MKLAILGFGTMGRMYARLIMAKLGHVDRLVIANRSLGRTLDFKAEFDKVEVTTDFAEACEGADFAILSVSPLAAREVLESVSPSLKASCLLVSFVSDLPLARIRPFFGAKVLRLVPTITSYVGRGISLVALGEKSERSDLDRFLTLLEPPPRCVVVDDSEINQYSVLTSCGPGIISALLDALAAAYGRPDGQDSAMIAPMLVETVAAACQYAAESGKSFACVLSEVATKGGITEAGARIMAEKAGPVFSEAVGQMRKRHLERAQILGAEFDR